jgi:hypothetical protein
MTDTDKSRFVATALGLWAWNTLCPNNLPWIVDSTQCGSEFCREHSTWWRHDIPPPELASPTGADLLLRTLLERYQAVEIQRHPRESEFVAYIGDVNLATETSYGNAPTWPEALLDAAYRLLKTMEEK